MNEPLVAPSRNLSRAWLEVLRGLLLPGVRELSPVIVNVDEILDSGEPDEDPTIRANLDTLLLESGKRSVASVANTIFPLSLWNPAVPDAAELLYTRYERIWPRIEKTQANRNGVYFRRLTAFEPKINGVSIEPVNQLKTIIATYKAGNHRRSALQACVFDPTRDHSDARRRGFPCLQQVAFTPIDDDGLAVTGFYASQYQVEKAYGNYLGLARLGKFVAAEFGLKLVRMTCVASRVVIADGSVFNKASLKQRFPE